ncbi:MAG: hypothetical protein M3N41_01760 [Acidobacteriota bacterium]|nr:hypothetical protein [Acidobacteriota bacterium]
MKLFFLALVATVLFAVAADRHTFIGVITDSMCARGDHSHMRMGANDAECTIACVQIHDASYVLFDGQQAYTLSDQKTPEKFAGQKVAVQGTLNANTKTIQVDSITATK